MKIRETYKRHVVCDFVLLILYWLITYVNDAPFSYTHSGLDYLQYPPQSLRFGVTIGRKSDIPLYIITLFLISLFISSCTSFFKVG